MSYYTKLPIVLLSEIASSKEDSYRCRISSYLLEHMGEDLSAEQIAGDCFVSKSAISRFCREIGLEDFSELRELLSSAEKSFELVSDEKDLLERSSRMVSGICEAMRLAVTTIDPGILGALVQDIIHAKRVGTFGLLKAETAAINLQSDLTMMGKKALTKVSFKDQMDFLASSEPSDLIIIFSYQGIFFEYDLPPEIYEGRGRVWVVTGNPDSCANLLRRPIIKGVLSFTSKLDLSSHPYQLLAVSSLIAQETARSLNKDK